MNTAVILDEKSAASEATNPVGTGPYKLASWTKGASITLDKWDGYRDPGKIPLAHATFRFISDPSAAVAAMLAGDVDAFPRFANVQAIDQFKADPRFQVLIGGTEGKTILAMNNKKKPLDDLKVRQAIAYAIDRKAIIDGAMNGFGAPIGSHLTPNDPGYVDLTGMYPHDPAKAKALLKEAGVTTPLDLSLILPPAALCASGRTDHRGRTRRGRHQRQDPGGRVGAVAVRRLQGPQLRPDHHQPRRAARHRHLRQSELLLPVRQPGVPGDLRQGDVRAQSRGLQGGARSKRRRRSPRIASTPSCSSCRTSRWRTRSSRACGRTRRSSSTTCRRCRGNERGRGQGLRPVQPFRLSALELLRAYRSRELSPREAMASVIETRRGVRAAYLGDLALRAGAGASNEARASEARWMRGEPIGPLDGVPATVKDNIATRGDPTPLGTAASDMTPAGRTRRPPRASGRRARSSSPRRRCPITACCRRACRAIIRSPAIPGSSTAIPADRRRAPARRRRRSTGRCMSAPTSAARSACRRAGAESSASSRAPAACRSIRPISAASPARLSATPPTPA